MVTLMQRAAGVQLDPATRALLGRMTFPASGARVRLMDQTIRSLKSNGLWDKIDVLWVLAAHDSQAAGLNWKNPATFALTSVNSPTFTIDRGYAGDGATSYLNTGWEAARDGVNITQNAAHVMMCDRTVRAGDSTWQIGTYGDAGYMITIRPRNGSDAIGPYVNDSFGTLSNTNSNGIFVATRTASNNVNVYRNGASLGSKSDTTDVLNLLELYIGALNLGGSAFGHSTDQIAAVAVGANIDSAQAAYYSVIQTYMTGVGA